MSEAKKTRAMKPFIMEPAKEQSEPAAGSKRRIAYDLIKREEGATFDEVMEATGWSRRDAAEGIRLLNKHNGQGLTEDEDGRIYLV